MTIQKTLGLATLALAAFTTQAHAANHEIFLGFRSDAAAADNDMIVSLGLFPSLPTSGVITNINADLVATFGANWNTRTDLFFGAIGANITGTRVAYAGNFADGYTGNLSLNAISGLAGQINAIDQIKWNSTNGIQTEKGAQGINPLVSIQADDNLSGWTARGGQVGAVFGNNIITRGEWEASTDFSLVTAKSFTLSSLTGTATWANNLGGATYSLDNAGNISVSAIPEPSTYGLMGAGALAAVSLIRRRRLAAKA